jgi:Leucine-rich repeat (LRR) protein
MAFEDDYSLMTVAHLPYSKPVVSISDEKAIIENGVDEIDYSQLPYHTLRSSAEDRKRLVQSSFLSTIFSFPGTKSATPYPPIDVSPVALITTSSAPAHSFPVLSSLKEWKEKYLLKTASSSTSSSTSSSASSSGLYKRYLFANQSYLKTMTKGTEENDSNSSSNVVTSPKAESLDLAVEGLTSLDFLLSDNLPSASSSSLKRLILNVNNLSSLDLLQQVSLPSLELLSLSDNKITDISALNSPSFSSLLSLNLDSNRLEYVNLKHLTSLHSLSLSCNQLKSFPILSSIRLVKLDLYYNAISSIPSEALKEIPSLTYLNVGKNQLTDTIFENGGVFQYCELLQTLTLSQNQLTSLPSSLLLPCLHTLQLNNNRISNLKNEDERTEGEATVENERKISIILPQLRKLYLHDNLLTSLYTSSLSSPSLSSSYFFEQFPLLSEVDLSFNQFESLEELTPLSSSCSFLTSLRLNDNPLTNKGSSASSSHQAVNPAEADTIQKLKKVSVWIKSSFQFLQTYNGEKVNKSEQRIESIPQKALVSSSRLGRRRGTVKPEEKEKKFQYQQFLQLLQFMKLEYEDTLFQIRKKSSIKKSTGPSTSANKTEEYQNQITNDISLVILSFHQKERLFSFLNSSPDSNPALKDTRFLYFKEKETTDIKTGPRSADNGNTAFTAVAPSSVDLSSSFFSSSSGIMKLLNEAMIDLKEEETSHLKTTEEKGSFVKQRTQQALLESKIIKFQSCYRGYRLRKKISSYLQSIAYQDDELDVLFGKRGNSRQKSDNIEEMDLFDFSDLLEIEKELASDSYVSLPPKAKPNSSSSQQNLRSLLPPLPFSSQQQQHPLVSSSSSSSSSSNLLTMAYGDHIRKRNNFFANSAASNETSDLDDTRQSSEQFSTHDEELPLSQIHTPRSTTSSAKTVSQQGDSLLDRNLVAQRSPRQLKDMNEIAKDWGINNPALQATMMKRNKKMNKMMHAAENREKDKDPTFRLEKFKQHAAKAPSGSSSSSSHSTSNHRMHKAKNGKQTRTGHFVKPAWLSGNNDENADDGGDGDDDYTEGK